MFSTLSPFAVLPCLDATAGFGRILLFLHRLLRLVRYRKNLPLNDLPSCCVEPKNIKNRPELIAFINDVIRDHDADGQNWENRDIRSYQWPHG